MKKFASILVAVCALGSFGAPVRAATLFLAAYPNVVLVFDEAKGQIVDRIPMTTGLPRAMRLSQDRKQIYVMTLDHSGMEVIDVATRKVVGHFMLDSPAKRFRISESMVADPQNKFLYGVTQEMDKLVDRWEIGKPKYTVIDVAQGKIVKTFDIAKEDEASNIGLRTRPA